MEGFKRQFRFQYLDVKFAFIIFWFVILLSNILFYVLNYTNKTNTNFGVRWFDSGVEFGVIQSNSLNISASNIISIAIFILVVSIVMYYESFPTAIGFSSTRKDFYKGVISYHVVLSLAMATVEAILLKTDRFLVNAIGRDALTNLIYFDTKEDNIFYIIIVLFLFILLFAAMCNLLGAVIYKFGYKFWIGFAALFVVVGNIPLLQIPIIKFIKLIFYFNKSSLYLLKVALIMVILYAISWTFVRRLSVK
ncbi:hypothetical protein [Clostridium algidicarnis]|uniref:hypothetical protein n=1 Tax=Clostridium algidicarnis TaxID=37659 RepID=UPI00049514DC|nr:hypothetical protein [Clostridium algidicarnis]